jgi:hypothetical protein
LTARRGHLLPEGREKNRKPVGTELPPVPVLDIRLHEPTNTLYTLYTSTFGLGMYKLDLGE